VVGALLAAHEPWRDELQSWSIARESASLGELFAQSRYEGHPSGWYLLLFAVTRASGDFRAVQLLNFALMTAAVALLLWRAPLTLTQKALACFGYFLCYEYAVLARNYALGVLALFAFCTLARDWRRHWLWLQLCLVAMLQANVFAALLACALFATLGLHALRRAGRERRLRPRFALGALVFAVGLAISLLDMRVPADAGFMADWHWRDPALATLARSIARAFVPIPQLTLHFWNTSLIGGTGPGGAPAWLEACVALAALTAAGWILRRRPLALLAFGLATLAIGSFLAVKYTGFLRHHGHFVLALLGAYWLGESLAGAEHRPAARARGRAPRSAMLTLLLAIQVAATLPAAWFELRHPFSRAGETAAFIREQGLAECFLVGQPDYAASAVAIELGRPVYYPESRRSGTHLVWDAERGAGEPLDIVSTVRELAREHGRILLIANAPLAAEALGAELAPIASFAPAIEASEQYYLYATSAAAAQATGADSLRYNGAAPQP
jgi:hypothetical protein